MQSAAQDRSRDQQRRQALEQMESALLILDQIDSLAAATLSLAIEQAGGQPFDPPETA